MATVVDVEERDIRAPKANVKDHRRYDAGASHISEEPSSRAKTHVLAMFCYEDADGPVGHFLRKTARTIAKRGISVHVFSRRPFEMDSPEIHLHPVGTCKADDLLGQVHEFTRRACNEFLRQFQSSTANVTLMGHEWSSIPAISLLHGLKNVGAILSLHSLERQRGGLDSGLSKWIEETELAGLREARLILTHDSGTAEVARNCVPQCAERIVDASQQIPMKHFEFRLDPGEIKARFQVGPVDPTILYIGDLDQRYGPELLMKAMPEILKERPQARCIFVGDGPLLWPLRVYSRYLFLDHVVRLVGHLGDQALFELIHSADVIAVPSTQQTPWWPIEAAWVAGRPVVATAEAAPSLLRHEQNCLLVEPDVNSLAAGIESVLADPEFAQAIAKRGKAQLEDRYDESQLIVQIEQAMHIEQAMQVERPAPSPQPSLCPAEV